MSTYVEEVGGETLLSPEQLESGVGHGQVLDLDVLVGA